MHTKTALLIDFDNVFISLWALDREAAIRFASDPGDWLQVLANTHLTGTHRRWLVARCYLNPAGFVSATPNGNERIYFSRFRPNLVRAGLEVVDCPAVTRQGKNAADIRIVLDTLDLVAHRSRFDEFVFASGDADFTPLLQRIRAEDRRITIMSPSYLASAYTAIADRIIDFDALIAILSGDAEDTISNKPEIGINNIPETQPEIDEITVFKEFVARRYHEANAPLNLAALAAEVVRICPSAKQSNWFGRRTFSAAISALNLANMVTSNQHLWDDERHQPPVRSHQPSLSDIPETIALFMRSLDFPRFEQKYWPNLFALISEHVSKLDFNFVEATRWLSVKMSERHSVKIARGSIGYVLQGCQFGGIRLDAEVAPSANEIGNSFFNALLDRAAALGIQLTPEAEHEVMGWLGLSQFRQ